MTDTVGDWVGLVHALYPRADASSWDNVGLQVGDPAWPVERVLVCLDVTGAVIAEAAEVPGTLVLAHHPLLFRPLATLTPETASGRTALAAARAQVAVVAAHTNLDTTTDGAGTSDPVARILDLQDVAPLTTELRDGDVKLVASVTAASKAGVLHALVAAGATERSAGSGDDRLEVTVVRGRVGAVVRALTAAHPDDDPTYDLVPLLDGATVGFGRVGQLAQPMPLRAVVARIRDDLPAPHIRFAGEPERLIRRVAVVGGAGDGLIGDAHASGADVFVTGDLRHHVTLDAVELGMAMIDAGHHATEAAALPIWQARLAEASSARGLQTQLVGSRVGTSPWRG